MVGLGSLPIPGGVGQSFALNVSADGSVVVGSSLHELGVSVQAFRWTAGTGMLGLGFLAGHDTSEASGVSADGSIVVGTSGCGLGDCSVGPRRVAFIWDAKEGMQSLQQVLTEDYELDLTGWTLEDATAISADRSTIVGYGTDPSGTLQAWIAVIPEPGTGLLVAFGVLGLAILRPRLDR